jgi:Sec7-like guanine-nucleotide exchange factor
MEALGREYVAQNPTLGLEEETVYVIAFSVILLNVNLHGPHYKLKTSKQEFHKQLCNSLPDLTFRQWSLMDDVYDRIAQKPLL